MLVHRAAEETIRKLASGYPVVAIVGPRQSGKTTLARAVFQEKPYVSLEDPDQREFADEDPRGFLERYPDGAVLDEIQRCATLLSYIQTRVDKDARKGLFVLTGSNQFGLMSGVAQSLAGRVAIIVLLPFSLSELQAAGRNPDGLLQMLFSGLYPPIYDRGLDPGIWYANYVATYIERDVRQMVNVHDLGSFQRFVRLCAARTGQLLNMSALAADCGITHNTAKAWISVLEASFIIHLLQPYYRNFNKRLVKTPKLYFYDTGLAAWLLGIQEYSQLDIHPYKGALFETWVVGELLKSRYNRGLASNLSFWRDRSGLEIDILLEKGGQVFPLEVKSGQTVTRTMFRNLEHFTRSIVGDVELPWWLVYGGAQYQSRSGGEVVPWMEIGRIIS